MPSRRSRRACHSSRPPSFEGRTSGSYMFMQRLTKADRRRCPYRQAGRLEGRCTPGPPGPAAAPNSHLRWHPLRGEWAVYAGHRQHRTFLPPALDVATAPGCGACGLVVFTQDPATSLGRLPSWHLELLVDVWAERHGAVEDDAAETGWLVRQRVSLRACLPPGPTDGQPQPEAHLHAELYPTWRMPGRVNTSPEASSAPGCYGVSRMAGSLGATAPLSGPT
jgi:hypothetical protein